jgi:hypothetical protein
LVEPDPLKARLLVNTSPDYVITPYTRPFPANYQSMQIRRQILPATAEYVPHELNEFFKVTPPPGMMQLSLRDEAVVFLGQRKTPAGKPRIVVIYGTERNAGWLGNQVIQHEVYVPQPLFGRVPQPAQITQQMMASTGPYISAILSPGIPDPADPTHLTIAFRIHPLQTGASERNGVFDVYLKNDDSLTFVVRDPASTQNL